MACLNYYLIFHTQNESGTNVEKDPINTVTAPTKPLAAGFRPNDIAYRLVLIPTFGIVIPLVTGMVRPGTFTHWPLKISFIYTIGIAWVIWEGNRHLFFSLRSYFDWHHKPIQKIAALLLTIVFYTVPVSVLLLVGWYHIFANGEVNWDVILTATLIIMICVVFITHVYETVFLVKESETEMLRNMELERAKAEAELEALKNQIDPHFIFNSLNTLSHLIEENPGKAKLFNDNLADVYRYILQNKGRELVLLREEVTFLNTYYSLLTIRYECAVQMDLQIEPALLDAYLIPPISLQLLLENAVKHNEFSDQEPLRIQISMEGNWIKTQNQNTRKKLIPGSSRIGLNNLDRRYRLVAGQGIRVQNQSSLFWVEIPLLKIE